MNGRYALTQDSVERIAIATVAAWHEYFKQNPNGVMPGQGFLTDYLKPFVERERLEAQLNELHARRTAIAPRELTILEELTRVRAECEAKVRGSGYEQAASDV